VLDFDSDALEIQWRSASAIATMTQNMPAIQNFALDAGAMPWLAARLEKILQSAKGESSESSGGTKQSKGKSLCCTLNILLIILLM
jgi:hypothetical protein